VCTLYRFSAFRRRRDMRTNSIGRPVVRVLYMHISLNNTILLFRYNLKRETHALLYYMRTPLLSQIRKRFQYFFFKEPSYTLAYRLNTFIISIDIETAHSICIFLVYEVSRETACVPVCVTYKVRGIVRFANRTIQVSALQSNINYCRNLVVCSRVSRIHTNYLTRFITYP